MIRPVLTEIGIFLIPFAAYALFLIATRSGVLVSVLLAGASGRQTGAGIAAAGRDQLRPARAFLRRAAGFDLRSRAYRKRQAGSRSREMSEARVLSDAPWLRSGPAARVLALLNGDGEEARVVGGAVRNALLNIPLGDIDIATTALPDEVDPPRQGGRHQMRADRHRPRHGHAGRRCASVRGHDLARGYRDLWPQGQGCVRPRLGSRCGTARLHHQRAFRRCRRHRARPCRRACRYRSQARALHRRCQPAHRRGLFAHPALLPHACRLRRRASPTAPDISPASTGARDFRAFPPNACAWKC